MRYDQFSNPIIILFIDEYMRQSVDDSFLKV